MAGIQHTSSSNIVNANQDHAEQRVYGSGDDNKNNDQPPVEYVTMQQVTYNSPPPEAIPQQPEQTPVYTPLPKPEHLLAKNNKPQKDKLALADEYYDDVLGPSGIEGAGGLGRKSLSGRRDGLGGCQTGPTCGVCGVALGYKEIASFCKNCGYAT